METGHATSGVADVGDGDAWTIRFDVTRTDRRILESLATLSDGKFGSRGLLARRRTAGRPRVVCSGVFDSGEVPDLLPGPNWTSVELENMARGDEEGELDLHTGVLRTTITHHGVTVTAIQFASLVRSGLQVLRIHGDAGTLATNPPLTAPAPTPSVAIEQQAGPPATMTVTSTRGRWAAAARQSVDEDGSRRTLTRTAAFATGGIDCPPADLEQRCRDVLDGTETATFDDLLSEHEGAWRRRWEPIAIDLPAWPDLERSVHFAQFHLLSSSHGDGEAAIGARGLTGPAYRGHVFWDTDVFVVPALAAMAPELARTALCYRWHRLDSARRRAAAEGFAGARFPWESADSGLEAAPRTGRDLHGHTVPIRTGQHEEHIVADVAWSVSNYVAWTGEEAFLRSAGAEILLETARYWQSRIEFDEDGTGHIRHVIGPDEYHEDVDDNAFTNVMARWNLREAADVCDRLGLGTPDERSAWRDTADTVADGFDPVSRVHEQFAGFSRLEPVDASSIGRPPLPADALLGRERIQQTQIIKQPDVMMLHHLIPDAMPAGSLAADLERYLPLTAHGSSLSPAISASTLARAGQIEDALHWFDLAARFDLHDLSGTTANGVHLATMGGLWQAFTQGFLGARPTVGGLAIAPVIPVAWGEITHRFHYRSTPVRITATPDTFDLTSVNPIAVITTSGERRCARRVVGRRSRYGWELS